MSREDINGDAGSIYPFMGLGAVNGSTKVRRGAGVACERKKAY